MGSPVAQALPAMQFVCNLVTLKTFGNVTTNSGVDQSLLEGYELYHDITSFKFYNEDVTWLEARDLCAREGAKVAVIDSIQKLKYIEHKLDSNSHPVRPGIIHAGIIRMDGEWVNVNTGLPVLSIPWHSGYATSDTDCVVFESFGVYSTHCFVKAKYFCELPIRANCMDDAVVNKGA